MASTASAMHTGFTKINGSLGNWIIKRSYLLMLWWGYFVSQYFFSFLSEVIIIPWVSAVPFIRGRLEVSGQEVGFWNAWDLRLILTEWPTAFCLLVWRDTPQPLWSLQPRKMQLWFRWPGSLNCLSQRCVMLHAEERLKTPTVCQASYSVLYMCFMSVNQIAMRNGSLSKPDVLATSPEVLHKPELGQGTSWLVQWCHCRHREQAGTSGTCLKGWSHKSHILISSQGWFWTAPGIRKLPARVLGHRAVCHQSVSCLSSVRCV